MPALNTKVRIGRPVKTFDGSGSTDHEAVEYREVWASANLFGPAPTITVRAEEDVREGDIVEVVGHYDGS